MAALTAPKFFAWLSSMFFLAHAAVLLLGVWLRGPLAQEPLSWRDEGSYRSRDLRPVSAAKAGFTRLSPVDTRIAFTNFLTGDAFLTNAVAHNGSGVALGDIDGDGWVDIYLCGLQEKNRLYRNLGGWRFEEVDIGPAACPAQLSTGAAFADVDGDGDLDLLVNGIAAGTRLFLNDGEGHWTEATDSGLSRTASGTSLALADIDGDGDLDLYCTHYIDEMHLADPTVKFGLKRLGNELVITSVNDQPTTSPRLTNRFQVFGNGRVRELPEVHGLYRNDGKGHFTAVQFEPGIFLNAAGKAIPPYRDWGLAVMFRDLNGDGAPDLYICNDNASPDRMWLNTGDGKFREFERKAFRHTSRSSMGVDIADVDHDGHDDIFVVDMLAREHARRMTDLVKDSPDPQLRELVDEQPRYNRNALFFGRSDGTYAERALMAGVAASDWSWCPLFLDVDLDGYEDLIITTGFSFDVMDQDTHDQIRRSRLSRDQLKRSRQLHPRWATPKVAFRNTHDGRFEPKNSEWGLVEAEISNGAALADLDNDGDLDLVVNNLNTGCALYRNDATAPRIAIQLEGKAPNTKGIGARITVSTPDLQQSQEMIAGGRYLSGDQAMRTFAAPSEGPIRVEVRWRNREVCIVTNALANHLYEIKQAGSIRLGSTPPAKLKPLFLDASSLLTHRHAESQYDDWAQQPLLPHRLSRFGPSVSWFDLNGDGWEDLVIGAARGGTLGLFKNEGGQSFRALTNVGKVTDDHAAALGFKGSESARLLLSLSNLESPVGSAGQIALLNPAKWTPGQPVTALTNLSTGSNAPGPIALADVDGDGDLDIFVGGRFRPGRYPEPASSLFYRNESNRFVFDQELSRPFEKVGLVNGAAFFDFDEDGWIDLALACEWGGVRLFHNEGKTTANSGRFREVTTQMALAEWTGLWTSLSVGDFDGDGKLDLVVGNIGRNSSYELCHTSKVRLFYGDWNHDGLLDLVESWERGLDFLPVRDRAKLSAFIPDLTTRFPTHAAFGLATVRDILGAQFAAAAFVEAAHLDSMVFLNRNDHFEPIALPPEAQQSSVNGIAVADFDGDGTEDILLSQNFYGVLTDLTRDDAGQGLVLRGKGHGQFTPLNALASGIAMSGEGRGIAAGDFNHDGRTDVVICENNGPSRLYLNAASNKGLRVTLLGPAANPQGIGAEVRLGFAGKRFGPVRAVGGGSGGLSQNAVTQVLGFSQQPTAVSVRWPNGEVTQAQVPTGTREMNVAHASQEGRPSLLLKK